MRGDQDAIGKTVRSGFVNGLEIITIISAHNCLPCVERTMAGVLTTSCTTMETRCGAGLHTNVCKVNVPSTIWTKHIVPFIDKASKHVGARHLKTREGSTGLQMRHSCCVERQTDCPVEQIGFCRLQGRHQKKGKPEADVVESCITARRTSE